MEAVLRSADEWYLDALASKCVNKKGEFIREGPVGMNDFVYAHWKAKEERKREIEEARAPGITDDAYGEQILDILISLGVGKNDGERNEWLRDRIEVKKEREWRLAKEEEQKRRAELMMEQKRRKPRDLKARLAKIAAMKKGQRVGEEERTKTMMEETATERRQPKRTR
jgi:hypothetical protein